MVSSQSKMMTASFCERETRRGKAMLAYLMLHFDKKRLLEHPRRKDTTPPTMQKIRQRRAYIVLPFDPLLGGGDMVALGLIDNGCYRCSPRSSCWMEKCEIKAKFWTAFGAQANGSAPAGPKFD